MMKMPVLRLLMMVMLVLMEAEEHLQKKTQTGP